MSLFEIVGLNGIASVFNNIWLVLLYNIITPIIIIILAGALIGVQYLIIKIYIYLAKTLYNIVMTVYNYVIGIKKVKELVSDLKEQGNRYTYK